MKKSTNRDEFFRSMARQMRNSVLCPSVGLTRGFDFSESEVDLQFEYELEGEQGSFDICFKRCFQNGWKKWTVAGNWPRRLSPFGLMLVRFPLPEDVAALTSSQITELLGNPENSFVANPIAGEVSGLLAHFSAPVPDELVRWVIRAEKLPELS